MELLDFEDVSALFLDFTISEDKMGEVKDVELVPKGADMAVTNENLPAYMEAQLVYKLHDKIKDQVDNPPSYRYFPPHNISMKKKILNLNIISIDSDFLIISVYTFRYWNFARGFMM